MKLFLAYLLCTLFLLTPASLFADITAKSRKINLQLTDQEKTWLIEHLSIRVGMDSEYAPYEWLNKDGNYVGMAVDYLRLVEQKLGVHFEIVKGKSWDEVIEMAKHLFFMSSCQKYTSSCPPCKYRTKSFLC
jgi:ABC-type amino acid transport substrate-binding protein